MRWAVLRIGRQSRSHLPFWVRIIFVPIFIYFCLYVFCSYYYVINPIKLIKKSNLIGSYV